MAGHVHIVTRKTKSGDPRYLVRARRGGRGFPLVHAGSFPTLKLARERTNLVAGWLAQGLSVREQLEALHCAPSAVPTLSDVARAYQASRVDLAEETTKNIVSHVRAIVPALGARDPASLTPADVQTWIVSLKLKPSSVRRYVATLRAILDFAGVDPNPARDSRVRLPREERTVVDPPSAADVETIIARSPERWRLPLRTLAETGMRVGELHDLAWGDVDEAGLRFRIRSGKTAAARRWVAVPEELIAEIAATVPREDRTPERRVFPGFSADVAKNVMARVCKAAGIVHRHPHDLRHRYASVQIGRGVPVTQVAAQLGHSRKSLTLDTYSHVLLEGE